MSALYLTAVRCIVGFDVKIGVFPDSNKVWTVLNSKLELFLMTKMWMGFTSWRYVVTAVWFWWAFNEVCLTTINNVYLVSGFDVYVYTLVWSLTKVILDGVNV